MQFRTFAAITCAALIVSTALTGCTSSEPATPLPPSPQASPTPKFEKVYVPLVEGLTVEDAVAKLRKLDLIVEVEAGSPTTAIVTKQSLVYAMTARGTTVTLTSRPVYPTVSIVCDDGDREHRYELERVPTGADFEQVWADEWLDFDCSVDEWVQASTEIEEAAYAAAHYEDLDVATLYEMCATVDATDVYLEMDGISKPQFQELSGMMLMCPKHPLAKDYVKVLKAFKSGVTIDTREERAFENLPERVLTLFDERTRDRHPDMLQVYCLPGLSKESAEVLSSGIDATVEQARAYLWGVCP